MDTALLSRLCRVYFQAKQLLLFAEETDPKGKTNIEPLVELRSALDHVIRAHAAELNIHANGAAGDEYADRNLDKALGHIYRAFFDLADWVNLNLTDIINTACAPFDNETIDKVFPEYYSTIKPRLFQYQQRIAKLRGEKDVTRETEERLFSEYEALIKEMKADVQTLHERVPVLQEYQRKARRKESLRRAFDWLKILAGAVIGWLLAHARWPF